MCKRWCFCLTLILVSWFIGQTAVAKVLTPGEQYAGDYRLIPEQKDHLIFFYSTADHYVLREWVDGFYKPKIVFSNTHVVKPLRYVDDYYIFITDGTTTKMYNTHTLTLVLTIPYEVDRVIDLSNYRKSKYLLLDHSCDPAIINRCEEVTKLSYLTLGKTVLSDQVSTTMKLGIDARQPQAARYYNNADTLLTFGVNNQRAYFLTPQDGALYDWQYAKNDKTIEKIDRLKRVIGNQSFSVVDGQTSTSRTLLKTGRNYTLIGLTDPPRQNNTLTVLYNYPTTALHATWLGHYYWPVTVAPHRVKVAISNPHSTEVTYLPGRFDQSIQFIKLENSFEGEETILLYDTIAQQLRMYRINKSDDTESTWLELDQTSFQCSNPCAAKAIMQAVLHSKQEQAVLVTWLDDNGQLWGKVWDGTWAEPVQLSPTGSVVTTLPTMRRVNYDEDIVMAWQDNAGAVYSTMWHHKDGWLLRGQATTVLDQADEYIPLVSTTYYYDDLSSREKLNHYIVGESAGTISAYYVTPDSKELRATYTNAELIAGQKINRINLYLMAFRNAQGELQVENLSEIDF